MMAHNIKIFFFYVKYLMTSYDGSQVIFIFIFMALNIILENYFEDVLSLVDQSFDIGDEILDCQMLLFNIFYGLFRLDRLFLFMNFGALQNDSD